MTAANQSKAPEVACRVAPAARLNADTAARVGGIQDMLKSPIMNQVEKKKIVTERASPARSKNVGESLPKIVSAPAYRFAVCAQYVKCGKPNCKCASGQHHGPYFAAFWKQNGRIHKRYIRLADVEQMRELSDEPRQLRRDISKCKSYMRQLRALVREYEELVKEFAGI